MATVLVIAEQSNGTIKKSALPAIAAAQQLATGGALHIGVLGGALGNGPTTLLNFGAQKVHAAEHAGLKDYLAEPFAKVIADLAKSISATHVVVCATANGKDMTP